MVHRPKIIDGKSIRPGDVIVGLPSSGLHTNGYSLAREILFNQLGCRLESHTGGLRASLGEELLRTHINYLPQIRKVRAALTLKGIAHITGGGLIDNIPRVLPDNVDAEIQLGSWPVLPLFKLLASAARVDDYELHQVFNMGIGMVFIVAEKNAAKAAKLARGKIIGRIVPGARKVLLKPAKK